MQSVRVALAQLAPRLGDVESNLDLHHDAVRIARKEKAGVVVFPELSMTGMLRAVAASEERGTVFMFTDASSKDASVTGAVASLASQKKVKVFPMTFGSCSPIDPGYFRIAEESGGQLFELAISEAGKVTHPALLG